jgi:hypothetical protein
MASKEEEKITKEDTIENQKQLENENSDESSIDISEIYSDYVLETDIEAENPQIFTLTSPEDGKSESTGEKLKPTFAKSSPKPFSVRPKGQSKSNVLKGKRPRTLPVLGTIRGDNLTDLSSTKVTTYERQWYDHALKSQLTEKIYRTKNTLVLRIEEMNQKKLLSLVDVYKIFHNANIPIGITTPSEMSTDHLSMILNVDRTSNFITTIYSSLDLQDTLRKTILDVKKLPVCGCGYIYVHPTITFSKHLADPSLLVGRQPGQENMAVVSKIQTMEYLDSLRYFLEIVYENLNTSK